MTLISACRIQEDQACWIQEDQACRIQEDQAQLRRKFKVHLGFKKPCLTTPNRCRWGAHD